MVFGLFIAHFFMEETFGRLFYDFFNQTFPNRYGTRSFVGI